MIPTWSQAGGQNAGAGFASDQQTTLVPRSSGGSATPTYTRATVAYQTDFEVKQNAVLSGEARMQGARRVANNLVKSEDNTDGTLLSANVTVAATTVIFTGSNSSYWYKGSSPDADIGAVVVARASVSSTVARTVRIRLQDNSGTVTAAVNLAITSTPQIVSLSITTALSVGSVSFGIDNRAAAGATDTSTSGTITFTNLQYEYATGQANQNPSEYVSNAVLSAPYHGAGVDGVRYFNTLNGNTVV